MIAPLSTRLETRATRGPKIIEIELKKKNATMLCVYGLHKIKKVEDTISSINAIIGEKNVLSYYFPKRVGELHIGLANVQCFNLTVYKQYLHKIKEICGKYVTFTPHLKSIESIVLSTKNELEQFGLNDINIALTSIIETLQNAPQPHVKILTHGEMVELVEKTVNKRNQQLKEEI